MCDKLGVEYVSSVESIVPGAQGRVLGVLARTEAELTMRTVARLAGVSANQATAVLARLASLGLVQRREAGRAALVALVRENEAARAVVALANLREAVLARLRDEAAAIQPAPASLVVFGSFATGTAHADSDLDVLVVLAAGVRPDDSRWLDSLGRWSDRAGRIAGNPVNLVQATPDEMPDLLSRPGTVWDDAVQHGVVLVGAALRDLGPAR
jgi:predicted nucleotidyltransferase